MHTAYEAVYFQKLNDFMTALTNTQFPASASYICVTDYPRFSILIAAGTLDTETTFTVQQATGASAGLKDISGASVAVGTGDDNYTFLIDVETANMDVKNGYDYVTVTTSGAAGSNDYACMYFIGWDSRHQPVSQASDFSASTIVAG